MVVSISRGASVLEDTLEMDNMCAELVRRVVSKSKRRNKRNGRTKKVQHDFLQGKDEGRY